MGSHNPLSEEQVVEILTSSDSHTALAQRMGVSRTTISNVREGVFYADVAADLPRYRRSELNCKRCIHWDKRCTLDLLDAKEIGITFARECASFTLAKS